jgi:hypothetical protein
MSPLPLGFHLDHLRDLGGDRLGGGGGVALGVQRAGASACWRWAFEGRFARLVDALDPGAALDLLLLALLLVGDLDLLLVDQAGLHQLLLQGNHVTAPK